MTVTSRRRVAVALPMAALMLALVAPLPSLAGAAYTFEFFVGTRCIDGTAPPSTEFVVRLRSKDGDLRGRRTITTDSSGAYETCFLSAVTAGDKLQNQTSQRPSLISAACAVRLSRSRRPENAWI